MTSTSNASKKTMVAGTNKKPVVSKSSTKTSTAKLNSKTGTAKSDTKMGTAKSDTKRSTAKSGTRTSTVKSGTRTSTAKSNTKTITDTHHTKTGTYTGSRRTNAKTAASVSYTDNTGPVPEKKAAQVNPLLAREALIWLVLAMCVFIFISFLGIGGYVGSMLSDFCFGVFGVCAWVFPLLLFLASAFGIANRGNRLAGIKFGGCMVFYICLCCFAALIEGEYDGVYDLGKLYERCAAGKTGGGVIGGTIVYFLAPALGKAGAAILLSVFSLVSLVLVTQKSLIVGVKRQGDRVYRSAKESSRRRKEEQKKQREWEQPRERMPVSSEVPMQVSTQSVESFFDAEYTSRSKKEKKTVRPAASEERQLDVSMMFAEPAGERRHYRYASGVTTNTRITGEPGRVGADVHEILPKAYDPAAANDSGKGGSGADKTDASMAAGYGAEDAANYINLERESRSGTQKAAARTVLSAPVQEIFPLQIEGVEEEDIPAEILLSTEADSKEKDSREKNSRENPPGKQPSESKAARKTVLPEEPSTEQEKAQEADGTSGKIRRNPRSSQQEIAEGIASVEAEAAEAAKVVRAEYVFPPLDLLKKENHKSRKGQEQEIRQTAAKLQQTLDSFGVHVTVTNVSCGPSVTRYELLPEQGVKVSRIVSLSDDIKLNLAASDIRIEAPIPGKSAVGIEVPNAENSVVPLRDLLESDEFQKHKSKLAFATGKDLAGKVVVSDIAKMPHLLIAGATGSGKSVCINTLIMSILYKAKPEEVKLIMIDPKVVELSVYNGIPHLFIPVVTDPKKAAGALNWGVAEMTDRYAKFADAGVRDLKGYNQKIEALAGVDDPDKPEKLPQIVIIIDELADLMMVAPGEVEDSICRLAQLARAAGIHLVIATQRPSVNVITGLIKANMPSRIAFSVSSGVDSRTIIDMYGAEKLLGKGDMLFYPQGYQKPARVQGAFVSDEEVSDVVDFLKKSNSSFASSSDMEQQIAKVQQASVSVRAAEDADELFADAGKFIIEKDKASIGMLQRVFKIGFNRAARIMDQLSDAGVVGPEEGTKPRKILMSAEQFECYLEEN
ncbi:MAG: DNA translocase FtsK 4TM domain-containing protein [Lachnospiraceae bacterium]|nr:DNA translocase FtsK 4TM domain-containing protein [Lachnospiraceae bacterium]